MLLCHKAIGFEGHDFKRGDVVDDAKLEEEIRAVPVAFQHFGPGEHLRTKTSTPASTTIKPAPASTTTAD